MLRLINVQKTTNHVVLSDYIYQVDYVTVDVVDVEKQETLGKLSFEYNVLFPDEFASRLLKSKGDERTQLTTITGEKEELIRKYFRREYEPIGEDNWIKSVKDL